MTRTAERPRRWGLIQSLGMLLSGMGLCIALAFVVVSSSEGRLAKEKQQLAGEMDKMKDALTTAQIPAEQIPGLLRVYKAALVREMTNTHFIVFSVFVLLSLLVSCVGLIVALWAKLRALTLPATPLSDGCP